MSRKGFTLTELLVVVVILGILVAVAWPRLTKKDNRDDAVAAKKETLPTSSLFGNIEIMPNIYDDLRSSVYIKVSAPEPGKEDASVIEIMKRKRDWEEKFLNKKVITMTIVTGVYYTSPVVFGLLIHYEITAADTANIKSE